MRLFSAQKLKALMDAEAPRLTCGKLAKRIRKMNPSLCVCQTQHVQAWIAGTVPNADYLAALAAALGVTLEEMYVESGSVLEDAEDAYQQNGEL